MEHGAHFLILYYPGASNSTHARRRCGWQTLYKDWQRQGDRPLLYVNTFNHMMGNQDSNPGSECPRSTP